MISGIASLPLHGGKAPKWLIERMKKLSLILSRIIIDEYGVNEFLFRLSNPLFLQAFGTCLGFDWHSSGLTTTTCGVLRSVLNEEIGVLAAGGKGKFGRETPSQLMDIGDKFNFNEKFTENLIYVSRISAKVDGCELQPIEGEYSIYAHYFFVGENGTYTIIQQAMNPDLGEARRYHWYSREIKSLIVEPHSGISGIPHEHMLNLSAWEAEKCRKAIVDLVNESPSRIKRLMLDVQAKENENLLKWLGIKQPKPRLVVRFPRRINWDALKAMYERGVENFEEVLSFRGVGAKTIRALSLIADLIYDSPVSWRDPISTVKFSFCVGGKDGIPYPVDRKVYDEIIEILSSALNSAKINGKEKIRALKKLRGLYE